VVKSVSVGRSPPSEAFSHVQASVIVVSVHCPHSLWYMGDNIPAGLAPQEQSSPAGVAFSVPARSQVHAPAGRAPGRCQHYVDKEE